MDALVRAHLTKDLAECLCRMGRAAEALPLATEALAVFGEAGHTDTVAPALLILGHALSGVGRHDDAIRTLDTGLAHVRVYRSKRRRTQR